MNIQLIIIRPFNIQLNIGRRKRNQKKYTGQLHILKDTLQYRLNYRTSPFGIRLLQLVLEVQLFTKWSLLYIFFDKWVPSSICRYLTNGDGAHMAWDYQINVDTCFLIKIMKLKATHQCLPNQRSKPHVTLPSKPLIFLFTSSPKLP